MNENQTPDLWGVFHVELVNGCPNNCEACASQQSLRLMDDATFEQSVQNMLTFRRKFRNTRLAVKLFGTGESVLHPCLGRFAARVRETLDPDFLSLSTNIKTLQKFKPDLPQGVAVVVASRLDDVFDEEVLARYGDNRLGILVPDASDATVARIAEINGIWPTPSIQLIRMCDLEIPRQGRDDFVRRSLPFSDLPPFKNELIAKLTDLGLEVVDEFSPPFWNIRATFRQNGTIDACLMRRATIPFDFASDAFYGGYFQMRKAMCANCPRHEDVFTLSLQSSRAVAEGRRDFLVDKGLQAVIAGEGVTA